MSTETKPPLSREIIGQMIVAMQTLIRLGNKEVKGANDDAELKGQRQFLARSFVTYAGEFLGCWLAVTDEYTPLVNGFAALQQRAAMVIQHQLSQQQLQLPAPAEAVSTTGDNAIPVKDAEIIVPDFLTAAVPATT